MRRRPVPVTYRLDHGQRRTGGRAPRLRRVQPRPGVVDEPAVRQPGAEHVGRGPQRAQRRVQPPRVPALPERREGGGQLGRLLRIEPRAVVGVGEGPQRPLGPRVGAGQLAQRPAPRGAGVVRLVVPGVVGDRVETDLRGRGLDHRVGGDPGEVAREPLLAAVERAEQQMVRHIVVDRVVVPGQDLMPEQGPCGLRLCAGHRRRDHPDARPLDQHVLVELVGDRLLVRGRLDVVVLRRHHLQGLGPLVRGDEVVVHAVEQMRLGRPGRAPARTELLLVGVAVPLRVADVVQRHGEGPYPDLPQRLELIGQRLGLGVRAVADGQAGGEGVGELHMVGARPVHQLLQLGEPRRRVGVAPLRAQIRVVLGRVRVDVHLVRGVEVELLQAGLVRPGGAVEALDDPAQRSGRPVPHRDAPDVRVRPVGVREQLAQGLRGVVRAGGVGSGQGDPPLADGQRVPLGGQPGRAARAQAPQRLRRRRAVHVHRQAPGAGGGPLFHTVRTGLFEGAAHQADRGRVGLRTGDEVDGAGDRDAAGAGPYGLGRGRDLGSARRGGRRGPRRGVAPAAAGRRACGAEGEGGEGDSEGGDGRRARSEHPGVLSGERGFLWCVRSGLGA